MLPITHHKGFHIPHSLATAAAIVAIVIALGWDLSSNEVSDLESAAGALDQVTSINAPGDALPGGPSSPASADGIDCQPGVLSCLLPLVLPKVSGF